MSGIQQLMMASGGKDFFNITISQNTANYSLATDLLSRGWSGVTPVNVTLTINNGIYIYSTSNRKANVNFSSLDTTTGTVTAITAINETPALNVNLPSGSDVHIVCNGYIIGMGGSGSPNAVGAFFTGYLGGATYSSYILSNSVTSIDGGKILTVGQTAVVNGGTSVTYEIKSIDGGTAINTNIPLTITLGGSGYICGGGGGGSGAVGAGLLLNATVDGGGGAGGGPRPIDAESSTLSIPPGGIGIAGEYTMYGRSCSGASGGRVVPGIDVAGGRRIVPSGGQAGGPCGTSEDYDDKNDTARDSCGGGGGGWGARGGSGGYNTHMGLVYGGTGSGSNNIGGNGYGTVDYLVNYYGSGGPSINTNSNSITWVGGFPSSRVFGAII